jgi:hypothetical protein
MIRQWAFRRAQRRALFSFSGASTKSGTINKIADHRIVVQEGISPRYSVAKHALNLKGSHGEEQEVIGEKGREVRTISDSVQL